MSVTVYGRVYYVECWQDVLYVYASYIRRQTMETQANDLYERGALRDW